MNGTGTGNNNDNSSRPGYGTVTPRPAPERPSALSPTSRGRSTAGRPRAITAPSSSSPLLQRHSPDQPQREQPYHVHPPFRFRRRATTSFRLPKQRRPPILVSLYKNPIRLIPLATIVVVVWILVASYPSAPGKGEGPALDPRRPIRFKKSSFDWGEVRHRYAVPPAQRKKIPDMVGKELPRVQHDFGPTYASDPATESRRTAVRDMFVFAWRGYVDRAWGRDALKPVTGDGEDRYGGWAVTVIESLDTLWIMDLKSEFHTAAASAAELDVGRSVASGVWTIDLATKVLGGLLGAYELSGLNPLLLKAKEVGEMVYLAFDTQGRLPAEWFSFQGAKSGHLQLSSRTESRIMAIVLELTRLALITGDNRFYDAADRMTSFLEGVQMETRLPGLWPEQLDLRNEDMDRANVFSASGASMGLFDALPAGYLLTGGLEGRYKSLYRESMAVLEERLLWRPMLPGEDDRLFPGTLYAHRDRVDLVAQTTHAGCALGATLAVGGRTFNMSHQVPLAEKLARSCLWAHGQFNAGLMPKTLNMLRCPSRAGCEWDEREWLDERRDRRLSEGFTHVPDRRYMLGPEMIKSLFVLWRVTGNKDLRNLAFALFERIRRETHVRFGYAGVEDVVVDGDGGRVDLMESYWFAATMKYFYLMYVHPDELDLDEWVFTAAGHPLRRPVTGLDSAPAGKAPASWGVWP